MKLSDDSLTVLPLPLTRGPAEQAPVSLEEAAAAAQKVQRTGNTWELYKAAIARSGLTEEEVRDAMHIPAPQWSVFNKRPGEKGAKHFPHQRNQEFDQIVGNDLRLHGEAYLSGYELRPLKTALEQENERLAAELEDAREKYQHAIQVLKEVRGSE